MRILVIGSGGREHTLVWKIKQSPHVDKLYCAPGNAGTGQIAENVPISSEDIPRLLQFAEEKKIDLTVVGPEDPLVNGIVDEFIEHDLRIFGPLKEVAILEGSKVFAKNLMRRHNIPTAEFEIFKDEKKAKDYIRTKKAPLVVKASGLAKGKGVVVAKNTQEAEEAVHRMMVAKEFGEAGREVIVEECLFGEEASILCFTDGITLVPMASAQDHKAIFDDDKGPNTGGMGAYSPAPIVTKELLTRVDKEILRPTISALSGEGNLYKGVLYVGLMLTEKGPKVLEYNARFGDPETQAILPRMKSDLVEVMEAVVDGRLDQVTIDWQDKAAVCVVMASGGYPDAYKKGLPITGLEEASKLKEVIVFHGGTKIENDKIVTAGGRVLGVTALGSDIPKAIENAYKAVELIKFEGAHYRRDIGRKALKWLK
jgi:phosphoribosylamine--glycine ligase